MHLLALETTTHLCGVALLSDDQPVVTLEVHRPRIHASHLVPFIEQALQAADWHRTDLDVIAVSMGPGSYTGLRIGVSAAKGLAQALACQIVGVSTLEALAVQAAPFASAGDRIVANLFARRGEVYAASYRVAEDGTLSVQETPAALSILEFADSLSASADTVWVVGPDQTRRFEQLGELDRSNLHIVEARLSALAIGQLGYREAQQDCFEDVVSFEPTYIKDFVARRPQRSAFDKLPF